ncbi:ATP-binding protein [Chryseolinea soli]|uniref:histidine kinase n=1 Tax=Chryseolinea soli TaxID=2321403 RepID=A0A385SMH7_9BACT|nr:ATP-binding protein [Chryseolinea soli]AYB32042.1 hypothetical protein D4L85_16350 [Chryseolinea soli]
MRFPLLVLTLICQPALFAQQLFVQPYPIEVYKGATQNWVMAQDRQGVSYFANNDGVLRYDGTSWDLMPLPNKDFVSSVAVDARGEIYVGSVNELGYFQKDDVGIYQYHSLMPQLPVEHRKNVKDIIETIVFDDVVLFNDLESIYMYSDGKLRILNIYNYGLITQGTHLYLARENGLCVYGNGRFQSVDFNTELEGMAIWLITGYIQDSFLVLDDQNKLWVLNPQGSLHGKLRPFSETLNVRLKGLPIVRITSMTNGNIAIVLKDEIHIVNKNGEPLYSVPKHWFEDDMRDGFVFEDLQHNLWLNANSIILQVITSSPLSFYDRHNGIKGTILALGKTAQHQYAGTSYGIFYKESKESFSFLPGTIGQTWNFYNFNQRLYAAHETGVFELQGKKTTRLIDHYGVHALCELKRRSDRMIMGTSTTGIWLLEKRGSAWHKHKIKGFEEETRFMQEDEEGNIWISHYNKGIYKLRLNGKMDSVISKTFYDRNNGLPSNVNNRIYRLRDGKIIVATANGIYSYSQIKDRFEPEAKFTRVLGKEFCVYTLTEGPEGNIYFWGAVPHDNEIAGMLIKQPDSTLKLLLTPFNKVAVPAHELRVDIDAPVLVAGPKEIWIGQGKKLLSYNPAQKTFYEDLFSVSIKKVWAKDSLIFINGRRQSDLDLPFASNNLRFEFVSAFYESPERMEYQYKLNGFENKWSAWALGKEAFFTNLPEGTYTFSVRAKNLYKKISEPVSFSFHICPPWYRTWWAYSIYVILFVFFFYLGIVLNTRRIRMQKIELIKKVGEKTIELTAMNNEILAQNEEISAINEDVHKKNEEIRQQAEELKKSNLTKDKLFSIVSHDLRGPIRQVQDIFNLVEMNYVSEEELRTLLPRLKEGISQTLNLTDNLLYWAKNQMGGIKVKPSDFDVWGIVEENVQLFRPIAKNKNIHLINSVEGSLWVNADSDMIRLVLRNLINNAIKFTKGDGKVTIGSEHHGNYIMIFVADTGIGLAKEEISLFFNEDHFTRQGTSGEKGMGLGLILCQEFIGKNGGTLTIESELNKGSKFSFTIKKARRN